MRCFLLNRCVRSGCRRIGCQKHLEPSDIARISHIGEVVHCGVLQDVHIGGGGVEEDNVGMFVRLAHVGDDVFEETGVAIANLIHRINASVLVGFGAVEDLEIEGDAAHGELPLDNNVLGTMLEDGVKRVGDLVGDGGKESLQHFWGASRGQGVVEIVAADLTKVDERVGEVDFRSVVDEPLKLATKRLRSEGCDVGEAVQGLEVERRRTSNRKVLTSIVRQACGVRWDEGCL
ncbi:hypothetical protein GOP47_0024152 [Adiantum capillus-veneris]|uniref:Uncharacterized protein n=1 Tax=Adiantum capillus-veneris TaxID=13818 RepID=A0A9D4U602_ADICA|nr:hypothetical protein GOP47_0024152 [Adiantum capillus-veneris]